MNFLKYFLADNPLTEDPNDFRAVVVPGEPVTHKDLIEFVMYRCAGLTESQVSSVMKEYDAAIDFFVAKGKTVETERYTISPRIRGVFHHIRETFDRNKHKVYIKIKPGVALKKLAENIKVERVEEVKSNPMPQTCIDIESKSENSVITPGRVARVLGKKLNFNVADAEQGIFLIDEARQETKVTSIIDNMPSMLTFMIPDALAKGSYTLRIKSDLGTKEVRTADLAKKLSVA